MNGINTNDQAIIDKYLSTYSCKRTYLSLSITNALFTVHKSIIISLGKWWGNNKKKRYVFFIRRSKNLEGMFFRICKYVKVPFLSFFFLFTLFIVYLFLWFYFSFRNFYSMYCKINCIFSPSWRRWFTGRNVITQAWI